MSLVGSLWVNKTNNVIRVLTDPVPGSAHQYVSVRGKRRYQVSAQNLTKKYTRVDAEWLAHAPDGTTVPDLDGRLWTRDGWGQWYTDGLDEGRFTTDLHLWPNGGQD